MKPKSPFFGVKLTSVVALLVLSVILVIQNLSSAPIQLFFWGFSAPVIAVILVSLLIGFLLGLLVFSFAAGKKSDPDRAGRRPDFADEPRDKKKKNG